MLTLLLTFFIQGVCCGLLCWCASTFIYWSACVHAQSLSCVQLFATPWTVARQVSLSWDSPGKNTGVGYHFLLQGIFQTQGLNLHLLRLLHCWWILYHCATWEACVYVCKHTYTQIRMYVVLVLFSVNPDCEYLLWLGPDLTFWTPSLSSQPSEAVPSHLLWVPWLDPCGFAHLVPDRVI